jgi:hypothetical protein
VPFVAVVNGGMECRFKKVQEPLGRPTPPHNPIFAVAEDASQRRLLSFIVDVLGGLQRRFKRAGPFGFWKPRHQDRQCLRPAVFSINGQSGFKHAGALGIRTAAGSALRFIAKCNVSS